MTNVIEYFMYLWQSNITAVISNLLPVDKVDAGAFVFWIVAPIDGRVGFAVAAETPSNDNVLVAPNNGANVVTGSAPPPKDKDVPVVAGFPNIRDVLVAGLPPKIDYWSISFIHFKEFTIKQQKLPKLPNDGACTAAAEAGVPAKLSVLVAAAAAPGAVIGHFIKIFNYFLFSWDT